jgi:hypothetical protein
MINTKREGEGRRAKGKGLKNQDAAASTSLPLRLLSFSLRPSPLGLRLLSLALILLSPFSTASTAFPETSDHVKIEYAVKAGFIYNFTKFIQWPEKAFQKGQEEFIVGVLGEDPFENSLDLLASQKKAQGWKIVIRHFSSQDEIAECHILFISPSQGGNLDKILSKGGGKPILMIGDTQGFAEKGVAVNFFIQDEKVRFEFNLKALEKAGIKVSSQLLHLGKIIE